MRVWLDSNMKAIGERAIALQQELYNKLFGGRGEGFKAVADIMAARVWGEIRTQEINAEVNQSIEEALR
jgi:hypothetical protein